jgi:hypothetical protein
MDTLRAKKVIARLFAIVKQRRERRASRHATPRLIFASPARLPKASPAHRPRALDEPRQLPASSAAGGENSLSLDALHDAYWLLQRRRAGIASLDEMMALYRQLLLRRGWSEPSAETRVSEVRRFVAEALGISEGREAAAAAALQQKLARLRQTLYRRK